MLKIDMQSISGVRKKLQVEAPQDEVRIELEKAYQKIQKIAVLPGFRVGKVPRPLLEKRFEKHAREQMFKDLLPGLVQSAVKQAGLETISLPQITDIQLKENGSLFVEIQVDIKPEVKLKSYKGFQLTRHTVEVTQDEIKKALQNLQEQHAEYRVVQDRTAKEGDYLVVQVEVFQEGKPPKKKERVWIPLDSSNDREGIVGQLVGVSIGENRRVTAKTEGGKAIHYEVKIQEIKEKQLPNLDDAFAKTVGNFQVLANLEQEIEKRIRQEKETQVHQALEAELLDALVAEAKLEVPESFVNSQIEKLVRETKRRLLTQGFQPNQIDAEEQSIRERVAPQAEKSVKVYFILDEIARLEKIEVQKEEAQERIGQIARRINRPIEEVDRYFEEKGLYIDLAEDIRQEKTITFLLKEAKYTRSKNGG